MFGAFGYALMSEQDASDLIIRFKPLYPFEDIAMIYAMEEVISTTYYGMNFLINRGIDLKEIRLTYPVPGHAGLYAEIDLTIVEKRANHVCCYDPMCHQNNLRR